MYSQLVSKIEIFISELSIARLATTIWNGHRIATIKFELVDKRYALNAATFRAMHAIAQSENSITDTFRVTGDGARRVGTDETKPSSKYQYDITLTKIQSPINSIEYRSLTRTSINKKITTRMN